MSATPDGPEPDGWELLRALETAKANGRREIEQLSDRIEHRFIPADTIKAQFQTLDERLDDLEGDHVTKEMLATQVELVANRIQAADDRMTRQRDTLTTRIEALEKHRVESDQFRRAILIAVVTSIIAAMTTIAIALIHIYG